MGPNKVDDVFPHCKPDLSRTRNPKLGATPKNHSMVIENRRNNQGPVQYRRDQERVFELGELVAEAAVGSVVEELFIT